MRLYYRNTNILIGNECVKEECLKYTEINKKYYCVEITQERFICVSISKHFLINYMCSYICA